MESQAQTPKLRIRSAADTAVDEGRELADELMACAAVVPLGKPVSYAEAVQRRRRRLRTTLLTTDPESRKPDHAPFREVERLKENSLHQFVGSAKRLKNLYLGLVPVHTRISDFRGVQIKLGFNDRGNYISVSP